MPATATVLLLASLAAAQAGAARPAPSSASLTPAQAAAHVGEKVTVCGTVDDARYLEEARSQPTFLNMGGKFPNHVFTAVIFGEQRASFGTPEKTYAGKRICVWGTIELYREKPQIVLKSTTQLHAGS